MEEEESVSGGQNSGSVIGSSTSIFYLAMMLAE